MWETRAQVLVRVDVDIPCMDVIFWAEGVTSPGQLLIPKIWNSFSHNLWQGGHRDFKILAISRKMWPCTSKGALFAGFEQVCVIKHLLYLNPLFIELHEAVQINKYCYKHIRSHTLVCRECNVGPTFHKSSRQRKLFPTGLSLAIWVIQVNLSWRDNSDVQNRSTTVK